MEDSSDKCDTKKDFGQKIAGLGGLSKIRRRLSVSGSNKLFDGIEELASGLSVEDEVSF